MKYLMSNEQEMKGLVIELLSKLSSRTIKFEGAITLALNGDLGTGKTTFTKTLAKELGIVEHITSPTFVIQKSYVIPNGANTAYNTNVGTGFSRLVHIDAYRLENGVDVQVLDLQNTLKTKGNLVVIEWAENIKSALPKEAITVNFEYKDETTREVVISGTMKSNGKDIQKTRD